MSTAADRGVAPETGHLAAHLEDLAGRVPVETVDQLWIFPTRRVAGAFSTVIVAALLDEGDPERRRVLTAHYTVRVDKRGRLDTQATVLEHGAAPADRLGRLIEGVLRRLDEELLLAPPREAAIQGDAARWSDLVASLSDPSAAEARDLRGAESRDPAGGEQVL